MRMRKPKPGTKGTEVSRSPGQQSTNTLSGVVDLLVEYRIKLDAAMPGSLTSRIRQLGPTLRGLDKNSCAVPKDLDCKPTDASSSWRDSRTSLSSSTMNAGGTSCVLIATRLNDNKSQNQKCSNVILSSPIMRQLTTPDRLYRMQHGKPVKPRG
jgi:hypothetical protein